MMVNLPGNFGLHNSPIAGLPANLRWRPSFLRSSDIPGIFSYGSFVLNSSDSTAPSFLLISDIHLHGEDDQSPDITKNSDSGKDLWDSAENKIRSVLSGQTDFPKPKFILYLGDLPWHAKDNDPAQISDAMENAGQVLKDLRLLAEKADIPLLYVPGNNDSEDGDYAPFSQHIFRKDPGGAGRWPLINAALSDTTAWNLGCYSTLPLATLRHGQQTGPLVLVLNSNIFTARYGQTTGKERQTADAQRELDWLNAQLHAAAAHHRRVLIAMHVPPGKDGYLKAAANRETCTGNFKDLWDPSIRVQPRIPVPSANRAQSPLRPQTSTGVNPSTRPLKEVSALSPQNVFLDLVDAYRHSIIGIVSSHTHMDGIRLLKDRNEDRISALLISAPGIAPGHGNNPGFKLVRYDPVNYQLTDFITLYNDFYPDRIVKTWGDLSYSFRQALHAGTENTASGTGTTTSRPTVGKSATGTSTPASMVDRIRRLPDDSLRAAVNSIYTVRNGDGYTKGNCVDTTLYVHYQP